VAVGLAAVTVPITPTTPVGMEIDPTVAPAIVSVVVEPPWSGPAARPGLAGDELPVSSESNTLIGAPSKLTEPAVPNEPPRYSLL
jgi:hypothetical protein